MKENNKIRKANKKTNVVENAVEILTAIHHTFHIVLARFAGTAFILSMYNNIVKLILYI